MIRAFCPVCGDLISPFRQPNCVDPVMDFFLAVCKKDGVSLYFSFYDAELVTIQTTVKRKESSGASCK